MACENVKGVLIWCFLGKQAGVLRSLLKGRLIAVSTLSERWMYTLKRGRRGPNHTIKLQLTKKVSDLKEDVSNQIRVLPKAERQPSGGEKCVNVFK